MDSIIHLKSLIMVNIKLVRKMVCGNYLLVVHCSKNLFINLGVVLIMIKEERYLKVLSIF